MATEPESTFDAGLSWNTFRTRYAAIRPRTPLSNVSAAYARYRDRFAAIASGKEEEKEEEQKKDIFTIQVHKRWNRIRPYLRKYPTILPQMEEALAVRLGENYMKTALGDLVVLLADDIPVGAAGMALEEDGRYYLNAVAIFSAYQGKGYCSRLVGGIFAQKSYSSVVTYLEVDRKNEAAIRCYKRAGFVYKRRYDEIYDVYERAAGAAILPTSEPTIPPQISFVPTFNMLIYAMACNAPTLPERTGAVSLELGVMADIGKLFTSAHESTTAGWRVTVYVDSYPTNYIITAERRSLRDRPTFIRTDISQRDRLDSARERFAAFIRQHYIPIAMNGLAIGGHGDFTRHGEGLFVPIAFREDGSIDSMTIAQIAQSIGAIPIEQRRGKKAFSFIVLDSCCLSTLENARYLEMLTEYILAYQDEGPWNGFVTTGMLDFCTNRNSRECLIATIQQYIKDAESQENPSPITLLDTAQIATLGEVVQEHVPISRQRIQRDLLGYIRRHVGDKRLLKKLETAFKSVVIAHETPSNYAAPEGEERHGLSAFL